MKKHLLTKGLAFMSVLVMVCAVFVGLQPAITASALEAPAHHYDPENIAPSATPSAASAHAICPMANINDLVVSSTSRWTTYTPEDDCRFVPGSCWVQLNWDEAVRFDKVVIYEIDTRVGDFELLVSNDGEHFEQVYSGNGVGEKKVALFKDGIVSAKHLRLNILSCGHSDSPSITEIAVYNTGNLAPSATVSASGDAHAIAPLTNINDRDTTNRWTPNNCSLSTGAYPCWVQLDWAEEVTFNTVNLYEWPNSHRTGDFVLYSVNDNGEATEIYRGYKIGTEKVVQLSESVTTKHLRFELVSNINGWGDAACIAEIEVYDLKLALNNLASKATAVASSQPENGNFSAGIVLDGDKSGDFYNRWTVEGYTFNSEKLDWINLEWDEAVTFDRVDIYEWSGSNFLTDGFTLSVSNDGVKFDDIYTGNGLGAQKTVILSKPVTAKYLRLTVTSTLFGQDYPSIAEIEVYNSHNLAYGASTNVHSAHTVAPKVNLNDGNTSSRWTIADPCLFDANDPMWFELQWDEAVSFDTVKLYEWKSDKYVAGNFTISISNDGEHYEDVYNGSRINAKKTIDLGRVVSAKYLRVTITSIIGSAYGASINEIEVYNYSSEVIHVHTEEIIPAKAPTCTDTGLTEGKKCSECGEILVAQETVDALGHTPADAVVENNVAPDCVNAGSYDSVVYCSVCKAEISRTTKTVAATGDHVYATEQERVEATCTENGYVVMACGCGATQTTAIEATGHKNAEAVKENEVAATCTTNGSYDLVVYCSVCNGETGRTTESVAALGHTEVADEAVAPTCTETGLTAGKHCSVCNEILVAQTTVAALGHTEGDAVVENNVASSCAASGSFDNVIYCTVCNAEVSRRTVTIPALGHTEVVDAAVVATCTETGLTEGKHCSVCNAVLVAQEIVDALGHTEVVDAAVAPSCTEAGKTEGKHCSVCNEVLVAQGSIDALGHDFADATTEAPKTCKKCGATEGDKLPTPELPDEQPETPNEPDIPGDEEPKQELNFFQRIWLAIVNFFKKLFGIK